MTGIYGSLIEGLCAIVAAIVGAFIGSKYKERKMKNDQNSDDNYIHLFKPNEDIFEKFCKANKVCLYTVNSYKWANIFQNKLGLNPDAYINEVVLLVRKKDAESQNYLDDLEDVLNIWKKLRDEGRIRKLSVYGYKNDPEHYYVKIGDSCVLTGHVYEDQENITGTFVDLKPILIPSDAPDGKIIIESYGKHFDSMLEKNRVNKIYEA